MRGFLSAVLLAVAATSAGAQSVKMKLDPAGSSVRVDGTSNVHDWHAISSELTADITMTAPPSPGATVEAVTISLPVKSLKSGKGGLDKNMYKAMNAEKHPTITFVMKTYSAAPQGEKYGATVTGLLTVNGVEKLITAEALMSTDGKGIKATGSSTFKMTDFGIKPVTALMGTIRTGDQVEMRFDLYGMAATAIASLPQQ